MNIPDKVINRLTLYHYILEEYTNDFISSTILANMLHIDNSQVRKDIKYLQNTGKCRVGYDVEVLKSSIERTLGFQKNLNAVIIGAGNYGSALAKYDSFNNYGLNISAMLDNNPLKINKTVNGKKIYDINKLDDVIKDFDVKMAILTVPKEEAQIISSKLEDIGIKYIWNFTPCVLKVSNKVKVCNENLIGSFLQFTRHNQEGINE